ncbi:hypothetical protein RBWH47_01271 [Rhodopirellula baltica WH47]|uniref:Uncharacterized protein n=1 Tax=Rhodopirellula baltica WH47 TaxID=991778 RepID=F2AQP2_RHOBT|nr:hypothetical protein RBWH47_01271 [Rhodopirellula baltica WH47]
MQHLCLNVCVWLRQGRSYALCEQGGQVVAVEAHLNAIGQAAYPADGTIGDPSEGPNHQQKECQRR